MGAVRRRFTLVLSAGLMLVLGPAAGVGALDAGQSPFNSQTLEIGPGLVTTAADLGSGSSAIARGVVVVDGLVYVGTHSGFERHDPATGTTTPFGSGGCSRMFLNLKDMTTDGEAADDSGKSGLRYQGGGWWQFDWKTSKGYAGGVGRFRS